MPIFYTPRTQSSVNLYCQEAAHLSNNTSKKVTTVHIFTETVNTAPFIHRIMSTYNALHWTGTYCSKIETNTRKKINSDIRMTKVTLTEHAKNKITSVRRLTHTHASRCPHFTSSGFPLILKIQESPANAKGTRDSSACMKAHCEQM